MSTYVSTELYIIYVNHNNLLSSKFWDFGIKRILFSNINEQATGVKYPDYQVSGQKYVCTYKKNIMYFPADNFFGHFSLLFVKSGIADTMCFDDIFSTSVHLH